MSIPETSDNIQPALRRAEAELARHLGEACEDHDRDISEESTDELLRLEEELLAAARAVDKAVKLRRQLGEEKEAVEKETGAPEPTPAAAPPTRVREFRTKSGSEWRVWEVRPGAGGRPRKIDLYPPDYVQGWLAFEALQDERRKRLPKFAPEWTGVPDSDLEQLLEQAVDVPKRKPRSDAAPSSEPPSEPPLGG
jgi:hypothetical protein